MSGARKKRSQKSNKKQGKAEEQLVLEEISEYEASEHKVSEHEEESTEKMDSAVTLRFGLATISKDIKELKQELRHELTTFKDELKREMKEEIINLRQEIDQQNRGSGAHSRSRRVEIGGQCRAVRDDGADTPNARENNRSRGEIKEKQHQNLWATRRHGGELGNHIPGAVSKSRTGAPGGDQSTDPASPRALAQKPIPNAEERDEGRNH